MKNPTCYLQVGFFVDYFKSTALLIQVMAD